MNQSISEQVKKEAEARYPTMDGEVMLLNRNTIAKHEAFLAGASFRESLAGKEGGVISENDMTVEEFYSGFNLDFMTDEEKQTIYTATELYARGKLRQASQPSTGMREALEKIRRITLGWEDNVNLDDINKIATTALALTPENECKWSDSDVKKVLEDYRVANMDCYLNPVIWFDKLNNEK